MHYFITCHSLGGALNAMLATKVNLVLSGVPQGTVLGPLLFIIFINDIYESVKYSLARSFADDTRLTKAIKSIIDQLQLQEDLDAVVEWADENGMELHEGKFELL